MTKAEAIDILQAGHRAVAELIARLTGRRIAARRTIGGGDWSAKDLVAHLTFWERNALEALDAWTHAERAPIERALDERGLTAVNADAVAAGARSSVAEVLREAEDTHRRLSRAIRSISDAEWDRPPTPRSRRTLGERLGGILGGPGGGYRHAEAHLPDLRAYVGSVDRSS